MDDPKSADVPAVTAAKKPGDEAAQEAAYEDAKLRGLCEEGAEEVARGRP